MLQIRCQNTGTSKEFPEGSTLQEVLSAFEFEQPYPIVSAKVNNVSQGLRFRIYNSRTVKFLDVTDPSGMRVYCRSLSFLLYKAAIEVFPGAGVHMEHPVCNGFYCSLDKPDGSAVTEEDVARIGERMREIVDADTPFHRRELPIEDAIRLFKDRGMDDKVKLIETSGQVYMDYYLLGDTVDYYYGRLVPSASYLRVWAVQPLQDGILLRVPDRHHPERLAPFIDQPKTFSMFAESLRWNDYMDLKTVGDVNHACLRGNASELIQVAEALQEKKLVQIAEEIDRRCRRKEDPVRIVLITGPSSSGKTTVTKRLSIQLRPAACIRYHSPRMIIS